MSAESGKDGLTMAIVLGGPAGPVARLGIVGPFRLRAPSVSFGKLEYLPHLDAECRGDPLLGRHSRASTAPLQVGDVRGLEVSGIG